MPPATGRSDPSASRRLKRRTPEQVTPFKERLVRDIRSKLLMLFGAVGFVLLIACANVASLLLARATSRSREFAMRAALGAGRGRLIGQLLAESVLLAVMGGLLGVVLAQWGVSSYAKIAALDLPRASEIRVDGLVFGFALAISIVTGILFGLIPSFTASRIDLVEALKTGSGGTQQIRQWFGARGLLVASQVALSVVLLIGAALLIESLARLRRVDPGFQPGNLLTMELVLPSARYDTDAKKASFVGELMNRVESVPGVRGAAVTMTLPMTGWAGSPVQVFGQAPLKLNERPIAVVQMVTPGYFRTLNIPLRRGRDFNRNDVEGTQPVAIISEALARRFWPSYPKGGNPVGQRIQIGVNPKVWEIAGIVADIRHSGLDGDVRPEVYRVYAQSPVQTAMVAIRTAGDPLHFVNSIRAQVQAIDADQAISAVRTMDDVLGEAEGQRRVIMMLLAWFAGTALVLSMVGLYGVVAYSVAQRTKEMGIRQALGAQRGNIIWLVVGHGLRLTLVGVAVGVAGALALTSVIKSLLFEVTPNDPLTIAAVALALLLVALAAAYIPARRATRVDPMTALRA